MADAGEIKAKVVISYDGSGLQQAKEDLASLSDLAGSFGQSAGGMGDVLSGMADTVVASTRVTQDFGSSLGALAAPFHSSFTALAQWSDALSAHQDVLATSQPLLLGMASSIEAIGAPITDVTRQFVEASAPMLAISEHAQSISEQINSLGDGFAQIQEPIGQSVVFLPQYADSLHNIGLNAALSQENMAVFQDALQNPYPFSMIQSHLDETGQSWNDFTSSVGENNTAFLHQMAETSDVTHEVLGNMGSSAQSMGGVFTESASATEEFSKQFNSLGDAAANAGKGMSAIGGLGPVEGSGAESVGLGEKLGGFFDGIGGFFGGAIDSLSAVAMPLMAGQMIAMMGQQLAQDLYAGAAAYEGPNAHQPGSVTAVYDVAGQNAAGAWNAFSEGALGGFSGFVAANEGTGGSGDFWGGFGRVLGGSAGAILSLGQVGIGDAALGIGALLGIPGLQNWGQAVGNAGDEGYANSGAALLGQPLPYPGPVEGPYQAQLASSIAAMNAQANSPAYLAAQASLASAQHYALMDQQAFDVSHPTGTTGPDDPMATIIRKEMQDVLSFGTAGTAGQPEPSINGCFIAGTRVLMADGTERAIETLRIGERVQSHAGPARVQACITPPPKQVYMLTLADGRTLTLTDSHPLATPLQGWKALSIEHAKRENPELPVTALQIGDSIVTRDGITHLVSIHPCKGVEQVYNITVGGSHTFYANGVLVHNKIAMSDQISQQISGIQLPHVDLSGITSSLTDAFSGLHLPHLDFSGITSSLGSLFSDIHLPKMPDIAGSISSELGNLFSGLHIPSLPDIGNSISSELGSLFSGIHLPSLPNIAGELGSELGNLFSGIHLPAMPDIAGQIGGELGSLFSDIHLPKMPDIAGSIGSELGSLFSGIQIPKPPDIAGSINSALSSLFSGIHMPGIPALGIPGFASGIESYSGGPAFIAENGPELVMLPSGSSVYPLSTGAGSGGGSITPITLSSGGGNSGNGGGGNSGPVHIHLSINGRELVNIIGPDIAAEIRAAMGLRSA